ncbi:cation:proton antiporter [Sphingomonas sp. BIUV-7]|uniref:Cation:proton antiporter n=1 Tax=Sphingomonas natans TaxID=3063330 RepID=A0ABT8Y9H8_9SPHN|nr:cation:proton antiporter [Sphingomonas sp. BIUV-7]MDO6414983.1 cation:proton antiporter [Sphingomonas sp. BIUV-7]
MTFFESLIVLMGVATLLLQVARRLCLPYPSMLAAAGVAVAAIPGAPSIPITPETALALFIAPILIDAAYDFPLGAARKLLVPLIVYAVIAVLVTAVLVALLGVWMVGLPLAAALTLGAIVAPPDAAAATAVLSNLPVSRRVEAVLKGESLFNDATALLLFTAAVTIQSRGGLDGATALQLGLAVPGGILLGIALGLLIRRLTPFVENTVGGTLSQFVYAFATWLIAERLHLSAVLATVASAMTIAASIDERDSPRMRVHSFAVWTTVVFLLNVLAFLLMGMQARTIFSAMNSAQLHRAAGFAAAVVVAVILARLVIALVYRLYAVARHRRRGGLAPVLPAESFLIGWTGMRGLVTLATSFALPANFPERDMIVLVAFAVVLATLIIQGATLGPLIRWFGLNREDEAHEELEQARVALAEAALVRLEKETGDAADALRLSYREARDAARSPQTHKPYAHRNGLAVAVVLAERRRLDELRAEHVVGPDAYLALQEDLDWKQLAVTGDEDRRIDES